MCKVLVTAEISKGSVKCVAPKVKKDFYFGYGRIYGEDYEDARKKELNAMQNLEELFLKENLKKFDDNLKYLEKSPFIYYSDNFEGDDFRRLYFLERITNGDGHSLCCINEFYFNNAKVLRDNGCSYIKNLEELNENDRIVLIVAVKEARKKFEKSLKSYLKRYGTKNINVDTYWADR